MHLKGWAENFSKTPNRAIFASICDIRVIWLVPTYALQTECICIFLLLQHKGGFGCRKYGDCTKWRKKCAMEETMCNFLCVSRTLYFPFRCEAISFVTFSRPFFLLATYVSPLPNFITWESKTVSDSIALHILRKGNYTGLHSCMILHPFYWHFPWFPNPIQSFTVNDAVDCLVKWNIEIQYLLAWFHAGLRI